jgi:hypothetical protein
MSVLPRYSPVDMSALPRNSLLMARDRTDEESGDYEEEGPPICKIKLSELRSHLDGLIIFIESSDSKFSRITLTSELSERLLFVSTRLLKHS